MSTIMPEGHELISGYVRCCLIDMERSPEILTSSPPKYQYVCCRCGNKYVTTHLLSNPVKSYDVLPQRRVVCAANRFGDIVVCGARHYDQTMSAVIMRFKEVSPELSQEFDKREAEQGFIDQWGKFMTREEAWHVAVAANQIFRRVGGDEANGGRLYSENLY